MEDSLTFSKIFLGKKEMPWRDSVSVDPSAIPVYDYLIRVNNLGGAFYHERFRLKKLFI